MFWACALGVLPITLMFVEGGLKVILSTTIVVSLPLLIVGVMMCWSLLFQTSNLQISGCTSSLCFIQVVSSL